MSFFHTCPLVVAVLCSVLIHCECFSNCGLIESMTLISEVEFVRICDGIKNDADIIVKHNPIGSREEILLWMLLSCLVSYLNLTDVETPCFPGKPTAETYRNAVLFVLQNRLETVFDPAPYVDGLAKA